MRKTLENLGKSVGKLGVFCGQKWQLYSALTQPAMQPVDSTPQFYPTKPSFSRSFSYYQARLCFSVALVVLPLFHTTYNNNNKVYVYSY